MDDRRELDFDEHDDYDDELGHDPADEDCDCPGCRGEERYEPYHIGPDGLPRD